MAQKDVGNKIPIYKLKTTDEVMKYYDEWGDKDKYNKDMVDWNYTGPKETVATFNKHENNKDTLIFDACLLYTSPSPRDPKTSRMPSSA